MNYLDEEIPKYRKKAKKRKVEKRDHKHEYRNAILHIEKYDTYYLCEYCTICGRIGETWDEIITTTDGYTRHLTKEELLRKYRKYEIKTIKVFGDKYVTI